MKAMNLFFYKCAFVMFAICAFEFTAMSQTAAQVELAVQEVVQMIEDHQTEHADILKMREPAGYQINQTVVVKAVFLRQLKAELPLKMHIGNALNAAETYCLTQKNFPANIVTAVKTQVAQELQ